MTRDEAIDILETITELYPNYQLSKKKATILISMLEKMEYEGVMEKLMHHVSEYPYPPTLAEIAAYPKKKETFDEELERWREEAKHVPAEVKQEFLEKITNLLKGKTSI